MKNKIQEEMIKKLPKGFTAKDFLSAQKKEAALSWVKSQLKRIRASKNQEDAA
jgi:hypothetical protein